MDNPAVPTPPIPPQPTVQTATPKKILWLIVGLAILTLGIALGLFSAKFLNQSPNLSQLPSTPSPTQPPTTTLASDPTAGWKTYQNDRYNFEIRYPQALDLIENTAGHNNSVAEIDLRRADPYFEFVFQLTPMAPKNLVNLTIGPSGNKEEAKIIGGIKGTKVSGDSGIGDSVKQTVVYFIKDKLTYYFFSGGDTELTDQILSTFKFTDQNKEICVLGQEYQNTAINPITCQCPSGYEWEVISNSFGPCRSGQARDCPKTVQKCSPIN